ncbi:hypothetical protein Zm00014a_000449 [Zea mays]|uniref:Uncharacterized protein n=1 Tax=Zea mays TaxID=4577 RepID=A0A3L6E343_MAIZE|nr:hypothetical protein Zm00014a_000449 [Zea mays]
MSSFRIDDDLRVNPELNQISSNLHGLGSSSTRVEIGGRDRTPASSEQRAESHGRKRKQSQIAGVLEEYLDYKRQHNDKLLDVVNQIDQQAEGCNKKEEYCIGKRRTYITSPTQLGSNKVYVHEELGSNKLLQGDKGWSSLGRVSLAVGCQRTIGEGSPIGRCSPRDLG